MRVRVAEQRRIDLEKKALGVRAAPTPPAGLAGWQALQLLTRQGTSERLAGQVTPQGAGLPVIHDKRVAYQESRNPKGERSVLDLSGIHDARVAEWSPGDRDRSSADLVIDDLRPAEDGHRISSRLSIHRNADDMRGVRHMGGTGGGDEGRRVDRF